MKSIENNIVESNLDDEISDDEWNDILDEAGVKITDEEMSPRRLSMEVLREIEKNVPRKKMEVIFDYVLRLSLLASVITLLLGWLLFPNRWWIVLIILVFIFIMSILIRVKLFSRRVEEFLIKAEEISEFDSENAITEVEALSKDEVDEFYHLWTRLLYALNEIHQIVPPFQIPEFGSGSVDPEVTFAFRDVLWSNLEWLDHIIENKENYDFTSDELDTIQEWKEKHILSKFFISECQEAYSIFTNSQDPLKLYWVCALLSPFDELVPPEIMPAYGEAVLLPYSGKIVYDGALALYLAKLRVSRSTYDKVYEQVKNINGVISKL